MNSSEKGLLQILVAASAGAVFGLPPMPSAIAENAIAGIQSQETIAAPTASAARNLMPQPKTVEPTTAVLPIGGGIRLSFSIDDPFLDRAGKRFLSAVQKRTGLLPDDRLKAASLKIECEPDKNFGTMLAREGYRLTVDGDGALLKADGPTGVLRGLSTLLQLIELTPSGFCFAGARIEDSPRFAWRGLLLDPSRHFISLDTLKRQIDAMEAVKLNVLHLHLSDNEGFRVESKSFPDLTRKASGGEYYTQQEIRDLVDYARERGVRILPEFDMPGHCGAIIKAYPELAAAPIAGSDSIELDPSREITYKFVDKFLDEMTELFPDAYYHMGGDEVGGESWSKDPRVQSFMKEKGFKDNTELQTYFTTRARELLEKQGKTMLGWDEIASRGLTGNILVQSWHSDEVTVKVLKAGFPLLISNGYYLDMLDNSAKHYAVDPAEPKEEVVSSEDKIKKTLAFVKLNAEEMDKIKGAEAAMWGEIATDEMIDARSWPRCAAIAERYWSPASVRDTDDMYRRLIIVDSELAVAGLKQHENQERMVSRLVPDRSEIVSTFLSGVRPGPNWCHFRRFRNGWKDMGQQQQFNELADAASPDALAANKLELDVKQFLAGGAKDQVSAGSIAAQLCRWRDNHEEFRKLSSVSPIFAQALPRSQDLHDLSVAGLDALEYMAKNKQPAKEWLDRQNNLIARQDAFDEATANFGAVGSKPQPPADLLIAIQPAVRLLVQAAEKLPQQH